MAGDWIKMRTDLYRDPKVCAMADLLLAAGGELAGYVNQNCQRDMAVTRNVMRNATVGALVAVWGVTRHRGKRRGDDLVLHDVNASVIDDIADLPGMGDAMGAVGWVISTEDGLVFPNFYEEMNTDPKEDAKKKAADRQRRFREKRNASSNVTVAPQSNVRVEKNREEKNRVSNTNTDFEEWYAIYPRKVKKPAASKAYAKAIQTVSHDALCAVTRLYAASPAGNAGEYTPYPASWLNGGGYSDDPSEWQKRANGRQRELISGAGQTFDPNAKMEGF